MAERILGVAIKDDKGWVHQLDAPSRHGDVIRHIVDSGIAERVPGSWPQGFFTNLRDFVCRIDAAKLALENGQAKKLDAPPYLYSEDLW